MIDTDILQTPCSGDTTVTSVMSIHSNAHKARFLARHFDDRIRASIEILTEECFKRLNTPLIPAASLTAAHSRLSPWLHYLHHKLQSAMRMQSSFGATQAVHQIIAALEIPEVKRPTLVVSTLESSEWECFSISEGARLSILEQKTTDTPWPVTARELQAGKIHISEALATINDIDTELYGETLEHIENIKLFSSKITHGFSDMRTMGAIFVQPPTNAEHVPLYYFEQIIHEMSHLQLHCIFSIDRLIKGDITRKARSPLRADSRSLFGVYHATYVSAKVSIALFRLYQHSKDNTALCWLAQTMNELLNGLDVVSQFEQTSAGLMLTESMHCAARRLAENDIWSEFDFSAPMQHRTKNTILTANRLQKHRQTNHTS